MQNGRRSFSNTTPPDISSSHTNGTPTDTKSPVSNTAPPDTRPPVSRTTPQGTRSPNLNMIPPDIRSPNLTFTPPDTRSPYLNSTSPDTESPVFITTAEGGVREDGKSYDTEFCPPTQTVRLKPHQRRGIFELNLAKGVIAKVTLAPGNHDFEFDMADGQKCKYRISVLITMRTTPTATVTADKSIPIQTVSGVDQATNNNTDNLLTVSSIAKRTIYTTKAKNITPITVTSSQTSAMKAESPMTSTVSRMPSQSTRTVTTREIVTGTTIPGCGNSEWTQDGEFCIRKIPGKNW